MKAAPRLAPNMPFPAPSRTAEARQTRRGLPTPRGAVQTPSWPSESRRQFKAACRLYGTQAIAGAMGYSDDTEVRKAITNHTKSTTAIEARWEAASSKRWIDDLRYQTRVVTHRGVRWQGQWLGCPALMGHLGKQVVLRGDGRGNLIVFAGALLKRSTTLTPVAVLKAADISEQENP